ncbi:hypothetical protein N7466_002573 [Penicillium verhagenii]|uniref:uncharacterized protein n=1 Tax=Penicillium verhagenii TaxID=1562060 RepID=UPI0025456567|nr:uncharacterized protein N7466_002573 [Penicillium verhagenii]KAJ5939439.1 hypothetical protein N7466_002573 [Penicillium verhagenii]
MACPTQPHINWDNKVQPLVRSPLPTPSVPVLNKSLAAIVQDASRHPWGLVDHHLYLAAIERGRDCSTRLGSCMLQEGERFREVCLDELLDINTSSAGFSTDHHLITFMNMPILPLSTLAPLTEEKLVLGFDVERQHLLGYFFKSAPDDLTDLCYVWHEGELIIDIHIDRFLEMYQYTVKNHLEICGVGISSTTLLIYCGGGIKDKIRKEYGDSEEYLRTLLSKASYESWFAVRDGLTLQQYRQQKMDKVSQLASCDLLFDRASPVPSNSSTPPLQSSSTPPSPVIPQGNAKSEQLRELQTQMCQVFFALVYFYALVAN